jgi:hypothetical protein
VTRRFTEEEWIRQAKARHGDRYKYDDCGYGGMAEMVKIVCSRHGPFSQRAQAHMLGRGCQLCGREESEKSCAETSARRRLSTAELVEKFVRRHGDDYDYS